MCRYLLEVCVDSVESALAAVEGGADRLELCGDLTVGGITPSLALFREIRRHTNIRTHILIRPRCGDFCYSAHEFAVMEEEIRTFAKAGAEGVVIGVLRPDGYLDMERMAQLMKAAGTMSVTLHRAFDVCAEPFHTLEQAVELGIDTILTSGQQNSCIQGIQLLKELLWKAAGRIHIMAGAGVTAQLIPELAAQTGICTYHMSGKKAVDSAMIYRKESVSMGSAAVDEYCIWRCDAEEIRNARKALDILNQAVR